MQLAGISAAVSFKNVLFLTDFSEASGRALAYALAFARHFKARLYPAHVIDPQVTESADLASKEAITNHEERKRQQLSRQVEFNGISFQPLLARCDLEAAVPHWISEHAIDLIVLGTHGRHGIERFLLGSTSEWVVRSAMCPVLTVGPHVDVPRLFRLAIGKILFPCALGGRRSALALQRALSLAQEQCGQLTLLHVLPAQSRNYQDRTRVLRFTLNELQNLLPPGTSNWCRPELAVDAGEAGERILLHARHERPDLIVMGLPRKPEGESGGGITYRVISSALCPVLTVPEE